MWFKWITKIHTKTARIHVILPVVNADQWARKEIRVPQDRRESKVTPAAPDQKETKEIKAR